VKHFSHLTNSSQQAFINGKWYTAKHISQNAFVIAGDGEQIKGFQAAFIQTCKPGQSCLDRMKTCEANQMLCFVHVEDNDDSIATFLIGAYDGAYIVQGSWTDSLQFGAKWKAEHFGKDWTKPLGAPDGPDQKNGTEYTRAFASGTKVWLDSSGKGRVEWRSGV
jgi:hypothetical protein